MPATDQDGLLAPAGGAVVSMPAPVPVWFGTITAAALALVCGFGLVGLALAVLGVFFAVLVWPLGALASVALFRCVNLRSPVPRGGAGTTATASAIAALIVAVGSAVVGVAHAGQHVLIDRDGGAYINTGRWLASHPGLEFRADLGPFHHVTGLFFSSPAVYGHGQMHFQFSHLLGVLVAEARWLGGDHAMFALSPILGAISLIAFYAFACHVVRPVFALVATAALSVDVVQLHFTRDAYSEVVQQLVLFGCLWLVSTRGLDRRRALFAGVLLGTTVAARIDGPLYLAGVPVVVGLLVARRRRAVVPDGGSALDGIAPETVIPFVLGVAIVTLLAIVDVYWRVPEYAREIGSRVVLQYVGLAIATVVAVALGRTAPRWVPRVSRHSWLPLALGGLAAAALAAMWLVRPFLQHMRGRPITLVAQIQQRDGLTLDPALHYYENSMRWHAWYLGPPLLALAVAGVALAIRSTLRHGSFGRWLLVVTFAATGGIYLWDANITPDQLWVMRRFLPIAIPAFVLFGVMVIDGIVGRGGRIGAVLAVGVAVAAIAWPLSASVPVWSETTQAGVLDAVNATCRALGPNAAVIVAPGTTPFHARIPQTLRTFCHVPVAQTRPDFDPANYALLARQWRAQGRVLQIVGESRENVMSVLPGLDPHVTARVVDSHELVQTVDRPPRHYVTHVYSFAIARVPLS